MNDVGATADATSGTALPPQEAPSAGSENGRGATITRVIAAVTARVDVAAVVDEQLTRTLADAPTIAALPADVIEGPLRGALDAGTRLALAVLAEHRPYTDDEAELVTGSLLEIMAVWGLGIEDVLTLFAVSGATAWEHVVRHASVSEVPQILGAASWGLGFAAMVADIIVSAPAAVDAERVTLEREAHATLATDRHDAQRDAEVGADLGGRVAVIRCAGATVRDHARVAADLRAGGIVAATSSGDVVASVPEGVELPPIDGATIVVETTAVPGPTAARTERLREILRIAVAGQRPGTWTDRDFVAERLLRSNPTIARGLAGRLRGLTTTPSGHEFLATARAYLDADCSVRATADAQQLHPETVRYRLRRLGQRLDLDLGTWHERSTLALSLVATQLLADGHELPPAGPGDDHVADDELTSLLADVVARIDRPELARRLGVFRRERLAAAGLVADAFDSAASLDGAIDDVLDLVQTDRPYRELDLSRAGNRMLGYLAAGVPANVILGSAEDEARLAWDAIIDVADATEKTLLAHVHSRLCHYLGAMPLVVRVPASSEGSGGAMDHVRLIEILLREDTQYRIEAVAAAAVGLGMDTVIRPVVAVADEKRRRGMAMDLRAAGCVAAAHDRWVIGLVPAGVSDEAVRALLPDPCVAALGDPQTVAQAGDALRRLVRFVALSAASGRRGFVEPMRFLSEWLLIGRPDLAESWRQSVIAPLERHDSARGVDLVTTLAQHVDCDLRRTPTAEALHLHPNSVDYRLRAISTATGLSFNVSADVLVLQLATAALRMER